MFLININHKLIFFSLLVLNILNLVCGAEYCTVDVFVKKGCSECAEVKEQILPPIRKQFTSKCEFQLLEVGEATNFMRLAAAQEFFQCRSNAAVYAIVDRRKMLAGKDEIKNGLADAISFCLENPDVGPRFNPDAANSELLANRVRRFTGIAVVIAGAIDGINPCVFATLVFFLSLLIAARTAKSQLLLIGTIYCFGCFLTYFLLGFGIFELLTWFSAYAKLKIILNWGMLLLLGFFAVFSLIDAFRYARSGRGREVFLQLPDAFKQKIHHLMRYALKKYYLIPAVFLLSVAVTLIESVCTGQIYIPTLVLLTTQQGVGIWTWYLLLYNIAFILPLIAVFFIAWRGISTLQLIDMSKRNVIWGKLAMFAFFLVLMGIMFYLQ